jgi:hypothetical protein
MAEWRYRSTILIVSSRRRWVVSFMLQQVHPRTHWTGGWLVFRTGLDTVKKIKVSCPRGESNPDSSVIYPAANHYTNCAVQTPYICLVRLKMGKFKIYIINRCNGNFFFNEVCCLYRCLWPPSWRFPPPPPRLLYPSLQPALCKCAASCERAACVANMLAYVATLWLLLDFHRHHTPLSLHNRVLPCSKAVQDTTKRLPLANSKHVSQLSPSRDFNRRRMITGK